MPVPAPPARSAARARQALLLGELLLLFVVVPLALVPLRHRFATLIIPALLLLAAGCLAVLLLDRDFDRRSLWNIRGLERGLGRALLVWALGALGLALFTWWLRPDLFLRLPRESTTLWLMILVLYPLVSVYPQELLFRTFLFHRYRSLLSERSLVGISAVSFALAHLFFANWIAPALSLVGGWLFATSYARHRSTLRVCVEHGYWGNVLFTVGLGWYFYGGSISAS
ncbi:MAG TPA: CPBP family intramembrane glutamic endopeptidase [Thermoanaerobaculia bacterium]|nr:CPBP family intramembrane glutamic endopeptidase [Thermoanaerobaculia bacterium]